MSGVLIIGPEEEVKIRDAVERSRAQPIPLKVLQAIASDDPRPTLMLKDRKLGIAAVREMNSSQNVMLGTYRAAISFEQQPHGLARHLSVSSQIKGKVPGPEVMQMVCAAFGFSKHLCDAVGRHKPTAALDRPVRIWLEEFEPGHMAINMVEAEPS